MQHHSKNAELMRGGPNGLLQPQGSFGEPPMVPLEVDPLAQVAVSVTRVDVRIDGEADPTQIQITPPTCTSRSPC
jgi:hypothetical protein